MFEGKVDSDPAAGRGADEMSRLELERIDQREQVCDRGPRTLEPRGLPESPHIGSDDVEVFGECADLRLPHPRVGDALVQEYDGQSFAFALVVDGPAVDRCFHQMSDVSRALN